MDVVFVSELLDEVDEVHKPRKVWAALKEALGSEAQVVSLILAYSMDELG